MRDSIDFRALLIGGGVAISKHNTRDDHFNIKNESIDHSKSGKNMSLIPNRVQKEAQLIRDLGKKKLIHGGLRKKTQAFTGFVIQGGSKKTHLSEEQAIDYFADTVVWLKEEFGADQVVQAEIHFDETTPHLHVVVSNLVHEKIKGKFYCSSKRSWGYEELRPKDIPKAAKNFSLNFYDEVSKKYGFEEPDRELGSRGKQTKEQWQKLERAKTIMQKFDSNGNPNTSFKNLLEELIEEQLKNSDLTNKVDKLQRKLDEFESSGRSY